MYWFIPPFWYCPLMVTSWMRTWNQPSSFINSITRAQLNAMPFPGHYQRRCLKKVFRGSSHDYYCAQHCSNKGASKTPKRTVWNFSFSQCSWDWTVAGQVLYVVIILCLCQALTLAKGALLSTKIESHVFSRTESLPRLLQLQMASSKYGVHRRNISCWPKLPQKLLVSREKIIFWIRNYEHFDVLRKS